MQPFPRGPVTPKAHCPLETERTDSVLLFADMPRDLKPRLKRKSRILDHGSRFQALLTTALRAASVETRRQPPLGIAAVSASV